MEKLYGKLNMSWMKTLLFAVITGIYTGAVMLVPALENTSFQDIGVMVECWLIFAVIIVVNCNSGWEASLKCFVFFLISQPLVYLVQIAIGYLDFSMALGFYKYWFIWTLLTLPGGYIAFFCKKQNALGAVVLGLGNSILAMMGVYYVLSVMNDFPHHILSVFVCFAGIAVQTLYIQKKTKNRIITFSTIIVVMLVLGVFLKLTGRIII
ncbi:MAG: hypothetical protein Q4C42_11505 [Clostridia bacterium]|nr:hypothetical protein [Clostridia bacterium]